VSGFVTAPQLGLLESPLAFSSTLRDLRALSLSPLVYKKRPLSRVQVSSDLVTIVSRDHQDSVYTSLSLSRVGA